MATEWKALFVVVFSVEVVVLIAVVGSALVVVVVDMVVVAIVEGFALMESVVEPRFVSLCISLNKTNPHIPRPRSVQRTRITKLGLNIHLPCFRVDTCCPSLDELTS